MSKINNKKTPCKSGYYHPGTCQQFKPYREALEYYIDSFSNPTIKRDVAFAELGRLRASFLLKERIWLLELEIEIYVAILLERLNN